MMFPEDLHYSKDHEWVKQEEAGKVRIGITDYAQDALGDIVFVELPQVGAQISASESFSEVESTKSVSDIYAPVSGTITEVNAELEETPELINQEPYGKGWICIVEMESDNMPDLMSASGYKEFVAADGD